MFGGGKVKLDKDLVARLKKVSDTAGYATVEEFVTHAVEKEIARMEEAEFEENAMKKLQGLGYIS